LIASDLLLECADCGVEGSQPAFGRIPPEGQQSKLVALMLAPGLGTIHS
jgi:hypothetical protein